MDPRKELADLQVKLSAIVNGVKAAGRDLNDDEVTLIESSNERITELKSAIERADRNAALLKSVEDNAPVEVTSAAKGAAPVEETATAAHSLGENFIKSGAHERFIKGSGQRTASAPEFKAATDTNLVAGNGQTQYGGVVPATIRPLTIADLLSKGTMSATTLTYWAQGVVDGAPAAVAEEGQKPQIHFNFAPVTETLSKLAVVTKISDEAMQDVDYLVSVINTQLTQRLAVVEEDQILNGSGTAPNLKGLLKRSGIQTYATSAGTTPQKTVEAVYHAGVLLATGAAQVQPDAVVINPADYETVRLAKDTTGNYFAGGPFAGGNPGLWGYRTVVTPAIAAGTILVGNFEQGAQLFRKGGVQVDSTNSNENDFLFNRVALRAEERILLAVYYPAAFVAITVTA